MNEHRVGAIQVGAIHELPLPANKHQPYPAYKPSGVMWLGDIPAHWEVKRLKFVARLLYGDSLAADDREDGEFAVFGSNGQVGTHTRANTFAPALIIGRKGSFGKVNYSAQSCFAIDTTFLIDRRSTKADLRWLFYALPLLGLDTISHDSAVPGLSREFAYEQWLPLPLEAEQRAIATYLDRETARLDALVAKNERLIELLQEKRTALISHAVTRGLDASAPLKDSGVAWLGNVPKHWEVKRLKFACEINPPKSEVSHLPTDFQVSFLPMEKIGEDGTLALDETRTLEQVGQGYTYFCNNDVILAKITPCFENGKGALCRNLVNGIGFGTTELHVLRTHESSDPRFVFYLTQSHPLRNLGVAAMYGAAGQQRVPDNFIKNFQIGFPPLPEQRAIAVYLDRETARIDALVGKVRQVIEKLQEYRTALISAAVTGKIDVRETPG